jgi:hypothetical protein
MKTVLKTRLLAILTLMLCTSALLLAQADKKAAELKRLETNLNAAKAKVALNERKIEIADSLINAGTKTNAEASGEDKAVTSEQKKLDKEYSANMKP